MSAVPTVRIVHDGFAAGLVINAADYLPPGHVEYHAAEQLRLQAAEAARVASAVAHAAAAGASAQGSAADAPAAVTGYEAAPTVTKKAGK